MSKQVDIAFSLTNISSLGRNISLVAIYNVQIIYLFIDWK